MCRSPVPRLPKCNAISVSPESCSVASAEAKKHIAACIGKGIRLLLTDNRQRVRAAGNQIAPLCNGFPSSRTVAWIPSGLLIRSLHAAPVASCTGNMKV